MSKRVISLPVGKCTSVGVGLKHFKGFVKFSEFLFFWSWDSLTCCGSSYFSLFPQPPYHLILHLFSLVTAVKKGFVTKC